MSIFKPAKREQSEVLTKKATERRSEMPILKKYSKHLMNRDTKKSLISKHQTHEKDTGSPNVQVAVLTERINVLSEHLKSHPKDEHSRRGLLGLVGRRTKHLNYLRLHKKDEYQDLIASLKLRK